MIARRTVQPVREVRRMLEEPGHRDRAGGGGIPAGVFRCTECGHEQNSLEAASELGNPTLFAWLLKNWKCKWAPFTSFNTFKAMNGRETREAIWLPQRVSLARSVQISA